MPCDSGVPVDEIVAAVRKSRKYRDLCADTLHRIAAEEASRRSSLKQAVKATKSRLHQAYAAYEEPIDYGRAYADLSAAAGGDALRAACRSLLSLHASTRERLPVLDRFYAEIHARTGAPRVTLDLACGLNPLSLPWMGLPDGAAYHAYDIDCARTAFLARFVALAGVGGSVRCQDVISEPPRLRADVALLLKAAPCLERQRGGATLALLDALDVGHVVVSYPVASLGRRGKGMPEHYARAFREMASERRWPVEQLEMQTELVFVVDKR